jgi:hypothetical protein
MIGGNTNIMEVPSTPPDILATIPRSFTTVAKPHINNSNKPATFSRVLLGINGIMRFTNQSLMAKNTNGNDASTDVPNASRAMNAKGSLALKLLRAKLCELDPKSFNARLTVPIVIVDINRYEIAVNLVNFNGSLSLSFN